MNKLKKKKFVLTVSRRNFSFFQFFVPFVGFSSYTIDFSIRLCSEPLGEEKSIVKILEYTVDWMKGNLLSKKIQ